MAAKRSRVAAALIETADDMRSSGILGRAAHARIVVRHETSPSNGRAPTISGDEIRQLRDRATMSQAAFARHLHATVGSVTSLERGVRPARLSRCSTSSAEEVSRRL